MRDDTLSLFREGYTFISRRCDARGVDAFKTRILLQSTICMRGEEAAKLITDDTKFQRKGAAPRRLQTTLTGKGGVQGMDGAPHRHRKAMFVDLMSPPNIASLIDELRAEWELALPRWAQAPEIVLFDEVQKLLCSAACRWAGIKVTAKGIARRTRDMAAMIEGAGHLVYGYMKGRVARKRAEAWAKGWIRRARRVAKNESALSVIAHHRDHTGAYLPVKVAAVELLNVLRPTVAVARYIAFAALALEQHPEWRERIAAGESAEPFVLEVRRLTPFFPFVAARARHAFRWNGLQFTPGMRVLLDLYGTNQHGASWPAPRAFDPTRFIEARPTPFNLIPQGPGEHRKDHRCPGEWATIGLMIAAVEKLCRAMRYQMPAQDLTVDLSKAPALPRSGVRLCAIEAQHAVLVANEVGPAGLQMVDESGWRVLERGV